MYHGRIIEYIEEEHDEEGNVININDTYYGHFFAGPSGKYIESLVWEQALSLDTRSGSSELLERWLRCGKPKPPGAGNWTVDQLRCLSEYRQVFTPDCKQMFTQTFELFGTAIHAIAVDKGFWMGKDPNAPAHAPESRDAEAIALIHSEISEALEALRLDPDAPDKHLPEFDCFTVEMADTVIRIMDLAAAKGKAGQLARALVAKAEYNASRPFRHGKKF